MEGKEGAIRQACRSRDGIAETASPVSQNPAHGERDFKKGFGFLRERNDVKYRFIEDHRQSYPVRLLCRVMNVSKSAFYTWKALPTKVITAEELHQYRRAKELFKSSRNRRGSRELAKKLNEESIEYEWLCSNLG